MKDLSGKVAVVTGAGSGIGRALANALAGEGAVVVGCDLNEQSVSDTATAITNAGRRAGGYALDVSDAAQVRQFADQIISEYGCVDILVNNAGIAPELNKTILEQAENDAEAYLKIFRRLVDVNLLGVVNGTVAFLPHLHSRPCANLANVASEGGLAAFHGFGAYCTTKFAVRGFTEALQSELAGSNVRVTAVYPGGTRTNMFANSPLIEPERRERAQAALTGARGLMTPESAAAKIVRAIKADRPRALLHPTAHVFGAFARVAPGAYPRLLGPLASRFAARATGSG